MSIFYFIVNKDDLYDLRFSDSSFYSPRSPLWCSLYMLALSLVFFLCFCVVGRWMSVHVYVLWILSAHVFSVLVDVRCSSFPSFRVTSWLFACQHCCVCVDTPGDSRERWASCSSNVVSKLKWKSSAQMTLSKLFLLIILHYVPQIEYWLTWCKDC